MTAANVNEGTQLTRLVDAVVPIRQRRGRPRRRPDRLHADKGYDSASNRAALRKRGIMPRIARRGVESSQKLGRYRWVVERTISWLKGLRRMRVRYDRLGVIMDAWTTLAASVICFRILHHEVL